MAVHEAAEGFDDRATVAAYERGRPAFPAELRPLLTAELGIGPGRLALDLGAGTGMMTALLLETGATPIAVEPLAEMRKQLTAKLPVEVLSGSAEAIPLDDESVDAAVVAQAFHWFDGPRALGELHRVLRPSSALALIWNRRDQTQEQQAALTEIVEPHRGRAPSHLRGQWRNAFEETQLFEATGEAHLPFEHIVDREGYVARGLSISFIGPLPDDERKSVEGRLHTVAASQPESFPLRYICDCYFYRRLRRADG
jgi:SAM-dependent methyltransferase